MIERELRQQLQAEASLPSSAAQSESSSASQQQQVVELELHLQSTQQSLCVVQVELQEARGHIEFLSQQVWNHFQF